MDKKFSKSDDGFSSQVGEAYRLSVNINFKTAEQLRRIAQSRSINYTETVRRAVAVLAFLEKERAAGRTIQIVDSDNTTQEIILL